MNDLVLLPLLPLVFIFLMGAIGVAALKSRLRRRPSLPRAELAALGAAITQADEHARDGRVGDGLACLVSGLRAAEHARRNHTPWAEEAVERWQSVVEEYATEHRIGPAAEIVPASAPDGSGDEIAST